VANVGQSSPAGGGLGCGAAAPQAIATYTQSEDII